MEITKAQLAAMLHLQAIAATTVAAAKAGRLTRAEVRAISEELARRRVGVRIARLGKADPVD